MSKNKSTLKTIKVKRTKRISQTISEKTLKVVRLYVELKTKITGKRFLCNVLAGKSSYNLVINSDMTVSCNCRDFDGSGHLGDLRKNTLREIFSLKKAQSFRQRLYAGKLPINTCSRCSDLRIVNRDIPFSSLEATKLPQSIMVENTVLCNLHCLSCQRKTVMGIRRENSLSLQDMERVSTILKESKITHVSYFNLGEPFLSPNIFKELSILRKYNPELTISVSTNGVYLDTEEKRKAALLLDRIIFSIDGVGNRVVRKYQRKGNFNSSYNNMKDFLMYRNKQGKDTPKVEWKYVLFNWNDKEYLLEKAKTLAKRANVDRLVFWPTKSPIYGISWRYYVNRFFRTLRTKDKMVIEFSFSYNDQA